MIDLAAGVHSGGLFLPSYYSGALFHDLSSGTSLVITPTAGTRVKLDGLATSGDGDITGVSISGAVVGTILSGLTLNTTGTTTIGEFTIGGKSLSGSANSSPIMFDIDEAVTIATTEVSLFGISYAFFEGV